MGSASGSGAADAREAVEVIVAISNEENFTDESDISGKGNISSEETNSADNIPPKSTVSIPRSKPKKSSKRRFFFLI